MTHSIYTVPFNRCTVIIIHIHMYLYCTYCVCVCVFMYNFYNGGSVWNTAADTLARHFFASHRTHTYTNIDDSSTGSREVLEKSGLTHTCNFINTRRPIIILSSIVKPRKWIIRINYTVIIGIIYKLVIFFKNVILV